MPFRPFAGSLAWPTIEVASAAVPQHGESVSGDGLFVEMGRQDGGVMLLLVDVMGHGAGAAAMVATLWNRYLSNPDCQDLRPAELLTKLHGWLEPEWNATQQFVAALALLVNRAGGMAEGANAGLPQPQLGQPGAAWQTWSLPPGTFLGIPFVTPFFQEASAALQPDQHLLAFTDGVTEAGRGKSHLFQGGPFQAFLASLLAGMTIQQVIDELLQALQGHVGAGWPEDDTTLLCVRRL
jgi:serine phosphatase RsbU (regulator of sigma subunit)